MKSSVCEFHSWNTTLTSLIADSVGIADTVGNVIYSGLCEGEKENGAGEKKMLAVVDFFLLFSLIPTFFQPQEIFFTGFCF